MVTAILIITALFAAYVDKKKGWPRRSLFEVLFYDLLCCIGAVEIIAYRETGDPVPTLIPIVAGD